MGNIPSMEALGNRSIFGPSLNDDQKTILRHVGSLFRAILVYQLQYTRQKEMRTITAELQVDIARLQIRINSLKQSFLNSGHIQLVNLLNPLCELEQYFLINYNFPDKISEIEEQVLGYIRSNPTNMSSSTILRGAIFGRNSMIMNGSNFQGRLGDKSTISDNQVTNQGNSTVLRNGTTDKQGTIGDIFKNLEKGKVLQLSVPDKNNIPVGYSVIYWREEGDNIILSLSRNDGKLEGHYKTIEIPSDTTLVDGELKYTAWYNKGERIEIEEAKKLEGVQISSQTTDRKSLSTYFMSVTPTSPVVLSTINTRNEVSSKRDFTIIGAKEIGHDNYDLEIISDDKGSKKLVRAKITGNPGSEQIVIEGEYEDRGFLRGKLYKKYVDKENNLTSVIRNVTNVQLGVATKPSKWQNAVNYLLPTKQSDTQQQGDSVNTLNNKVSTPSSGRETSQLKHQDQGYYFDRIKEALKYRGTNNALIVKTVNNETLVLNLIEDVSEQASDYYSFSVQIGAKDARNYLIIKKSDLNNLGKDGNHQLNISLSGTNLRETTVGISRILIDGKDIIEKVVEDRACQQPHKPSHQYTSKVTPSAQHKPQGSMLSRGIGWLKKNILGK